MYLVLVSFTCSDYNICMLLQISGTSTSSTCPKDILILVDESSRALRQDTTEIVQTLSSVIQQLDIGPNANLVGLYGYDTSIHTKFHLDQYTDKGSLLMHLQRDNVFSRFHLPRKDDAQAVEFLVDYAMNSKQGDRPDFPDAVVIIGDPTTASITQVSVADRIQLNAKSHDVIVVSLGSTSSKEDLLATDRNHMIHIPDTSSLDQVLIPKLLELLNQC